MPGLAPYVFSPGAHMPGLSRLCTLELSCNFRHVRKPLAHPGIFCPGLHSHAFPPGEIITTARGSMPGLALTRAHTRGESRAYPGRRNRQPGHPLAPSSWAHSWYSHEGTWPFQKPCLITRKAPCLLEGARPAGAAPFPRGPTRNELPYGMCSV